jgi:AAA family ATP:ADP antiporter
VKLLRRVVDVRDDEVRAMLVSFAYFFCVLTSWFVLRPIRDAVGAASGVSGLPWLFAGTLTGTLLFQPLFSALVVRYPARKFIPITYHFFVANLLVFYLMFRTGTSEVWTGRAFFVWTSVFTLFVVSVFWCFMADVFRSEQAKRLFGFIGLGGTLGSVIGSAVTASLANRLGTANLILVSVVMLELAVLCVVRFPLRDDSGRTIRSDAVIGGSIWAGFTHILRSPYLTGISLFQILYVLGSTFLYFAQSDIVGKTYPDREARTAALASIELAVQLLTIVTQAFLTGRVIRRVGMGGTLAFQPLLTIAGFAALAASPVFATLSVFIVLRRASNFALTNPAVEALFTVVSREDKYKAKSFIETFVYRGGDQLAAWTYGGLTAVGLGLVGISIAAVPMAALWLMLGLWLGRRQTTLAVVSSEFVDVNPVARRYPGPAGQGSPRTADAPGNGLCLEGGVQRRGHDAIDERRRDRSGKPGLTGELRP